MKKILVIAAALTALTAPAQDLTTEIDDERTIVPEHKAASPLSSVVPAPVNASDRPLLELAEYSLSTPAAPSAGIFDANGGNGLPLTSPYRGYAAIGYFPALNIAGAAGYRFIDTERTTLAAALRYEGASWHALHRPDGSKGSASDHTFGINAGARHSFGKIGLKIDGDYFHTAVATPLAVDKYSRGIDGAAIAAEAGADGTFSWSARIHYIYTGVNDAPDGLKSPSENSYGIAARGSYRFGSGLTAFLRAGIEAAGRDGREWSADLAGNSVLADPEYRTTAVASFVPGVEYSSGAFTARAGVRVDIGTHTRYSAVHVAPDVRLAWTPGARFAVYVRAGGGEKVGSMRRFYNYSPFAVGANTAAAELTSVDALVGVRIGSLRGLMAGAEGRYVHTDGAAMLQSTALGTVFAPVDLSGWRGRLYVRYGAPFAGFYVEGSAEKLANSYRHAFADDPDRPEWIAEVKTGARPLDALTVEARWQYRGSRCAFRPSTAGADRISLGNVSNLALEAVYNINERLSCGLTLENLLCRRYQIVEGLRSQGINGLAGVQYKF